MRHEPCCRSPRNRTILARGQTLFYTVKRRGLMGARKEKDQADQRWIAAYAALEAGDTRPLADCLYSKIPMTSGVRFVLAALLDPHPQQSRTFFTGEVCLKVAKRDGRRIVKSERAMRNSAIIADIAKYVLSGASIEKAIAETANHFNISERQCFSIYAAGGKPTVRIAKLQNRGMSMEARLSDSTSGCRKR